MNNPRLTKKDRALLKGSIRRVFSRSELRKKILDLNKVEHFDPNRPRVKKWSFCSSCGVVSPSYLMQIDHIEPLQPIGVELEHMSMDELVNRAWCEEHNLQTMDLTCHKDKSRIENAERRLLKKGKL